jgi:NADPH:quinone reductase-like Zn-dependent oxidoreductase
MKAVGFFEPLPVMHDRSLLDLDIAPPTPLPHDLLVSIKAVSVNPVDTKVRKSAQPESGVARVLGFDAVGVVQAVGDHVQRLQVGDRVFYAGSIARPGTCHESP